MFTRIAALIVKEFLQVFRDPRMKFVMFVSPIVQIMIFGYAATMDITNIPTAVYDMDNTKESRDIIRDFSYSKYFDIQNYLQKEEDIKYVMDRARIKAVIKFNHGFAQALTGNDSAPMQIIVDGTDSNAAQIILSYSGTIVNNYNARALQDRANIFIKRKNIYPSVELKDRQWFNVNLYSKNFYLPGVVAMIVTLMSLILTSMAIVREKEIGTMEQLIVSPIRSIELILGKIIPFGIIAIVQMVMVATVGVLWFNIPCIGSIPLLFGATLIYLLTSLGIGLFISTISSTQQEAMMAVFLFYFPAILLSGFAYPVANMPQWVQVITTVNPLKYYLVILRSIFLKGVGINVLWDEMLILLVMGVAVITLSSSRFQKNLG
ncbi:MAG: ABC transporter permease [Candidatus Omnitrophota bacterium]|nr:ABC transporter permease [Candidatus Omnitrophota bacterium]